MEQLNNMDELSDSAFKLRILEMTKSEQLDRDIVNDLERELEVRLLLDGDRKWKKWQHAVKYLKLVLEMKELESDVEESDDEELNESEDLEKSDKSYKLDKVVDSNRLNKSNDVDKSKTLDEPRNVEKSKTLEKSKNIGKKEELCLPLRDLLISKKIEPFDGNFEMWMNFKTAVEYWIISNASEKELVKIATIRSLLSKDALFVWNDVTVKGESLRRTWAKFTRAITDPNKLTIYIREKVIEIGQIRDKYQQRDLEDCLDEVRKIRQLVSIIGDACYTLSSELIFGISRKFWPEEKEKMRNNCRTLESLQKRIEKLYANALDLFENKEKTGKFGTTEENQKTNATAVTCYSGNQRSHLANEGQTPISSLDKEQTVCEEGDTRKMEDWTDVTLVHPEGSMWKTVFGTIDWKGSKIVDNMKEEMKKVFHRSLYMDDILVTANDEVSLIDAMKEAMECFKEAGFEMHKIYSNGQSFREAFGSVGLESKVLGARWNLDTDRWSIMWNVKADVKTKRDLLSLVGKCFDPMGLFESVKLPLRVAFSRSVELDWEESRIVNSRLLWKKEGKEKLEETLNRLKHRLKRNMFEWCEQEIPRIWNGEYAELAIVTEGFFMHYHEVIHPGTEITEMRIVANAFFGSNSLIKLLWKGKSLDLDVLSNLIRMRRGKYRTIEDLKREFWQWQIGIAEEHRKCLKLLWKERLKDQAGQLKTMQMKMLSFVCASSGIIYIPTIVTQMLEKISENMEETIGKVFRQWINIDDIFGTVNNRTSLLSATIEERNYLNEFGFEMFRIHPDNHSLEEVIGSVQETRVLNLNWKIDTDYWNIRRNVSSTDVKRKGDLLSLIKKCFEHMRLCEQEKFALKLKFSQYLGLNWKEELPEEIRAEVIEWRQIVVNLENIQTVRKTIVKRTDLEKTDWIEQYDESRIDLDELRSSPNCFSAETNREILIILKLDVNLKLEIRYLGRMDGKSAAYPRGCRRGNCTNLPILGSEVSNLDEQTEEIHPKPIGNVRKSDEDMEVENSMDQTGKLTMEAHGKSLYHGVEISLTCIMLELKVIRMNRTTRDVISECWKRRRIRGEALEPIGSF